MKVKIPKKIAMINDIAGFGRCSTAAALPVLSVMKVQACLAPTSVFSNHTAFPTCYFDDYTEKMPAYLDAWKELGLSFDGILCGFLGSVRQIEIVKSFIDSQSAYRPRVIIDPVMGDNGRAYRTVTPEHCAEMKELVTKAGIITPNITEACLLTDTPYRSDGWSAGALYEVAAKLHALGPSHVVITGIRDNEYYVNYISYDDISCTYSTEAAGESRPGTGDIFAAIIAADAVNGKVFLSSVRKAADFICTCTNASSQAGIPVEEGVCFENFLQFLL